jgi:hypothetical protein
MHGMLFSGSDAAVLTLMAVCMLCWYQQSGLKQKCMHCVLDEEFDTSCYWHMTAIHEYFHLNTNSCCTLGNAMFSLPA